MGSLKKILVNKHSCKSIWFMRQAGRYLPEFREIRSKNVNFIELCLNSELSSEITLQPIKRYNLDSAIIFSDILMAPYALGQNITWKTIADFRPSDIHLYGNGTERLYMSSDGMLIGSRNDGTRLNYPCTNYTLSCNSSSAGAAWFRVAKLVARGTYRVHCQTNGGYYGPGVTSFTCMRHWDATTLYVNEIDKVINNEYKKT